MLECLPRADGPVFLYTPFSVVILHELSDRTTDFLNVPHDLAVDGLLFEGSIEPLHTPLGLGLVHEGEAELDAPESHLIEEMVGNRGPATIFSRKAATIRSVRIDFVCNMLFLNMFFGALQFLDKGKNRKGLMMSGKLRFEFDQHFTILIIRYQATTLL